MSKLTVEVVEQFETQEPVEEDGSVVAHLRVATAKVRRSGKHVATLSIGLRLAKDEDEDPQLTILLQPLDGDIGYETSSELTLNNGALVLATAELLKQVIPFIKDQHGRKVSLISPTPYAYFRNVEEDDTLS